jgi:hypothetical protein
MYGRDGGVMGTYIKGDLGRAHAFDLLTAQDACQRGLSESWPFPRWIKIWHDGQPMPVMAWLNAAYCEWYRVDGYSYIGHCDRIVWPDDIAHEFQENDLRAIQQAGTPLLITERSPRGNEPTILVRKFAYRVETEHVKGWAIYGECVPRE